ncbi:37S ribosomal protein S9, mitochondrial [Desmophyllum pertusum]|uniref:37S ribosomal protein S9, mitochondrial n=1 Tax=Desmophyllum pertusum TaxID=174260 RepID=A0A9X0D3T7_9CNID|nr:37S ribosomal protein S9, mitochondrial [Desmophyllum pertusum]
MKKLSHVPGAFPSSGLNESLKPPENVVDAAASTDTTSSAASEEGQDDEDPLMQQMMITYDRYRHWIAKLMGKDPESFGKKELEEAIAYLMPSGLYAKDSRPVFEDPRINRTSLGLDVGVDKKGNPLAAAFFTGQVGFHNTLYEIYEQTAKLDAADEQSLPEDVQTSDSETSGEEDSPDSSDDKSSDDDEDNKIQKVRIQPKMRWVSKLELEREIKEALTDKEYGVILHRLKKLARHRNAYQGTPFLLRFLRIIPIPGMEDAKSRQLNENGEAFAEGDRKRAIARVTAKRGSGNVTINDVPFTKYFGRMEDRKQIMSPFLAVDAVGEYDVKCDVIGGGSSGQSGAIRLAISRALLSFEDSYLEPLQKARLLIRDSRIKERKKPGQKRARKKFTWVRR